MSVWKRVALIVFLSLACLVTSHGSSYLLAKIPEITWELATLLASALSALAWIAPLLVFPSLRDVGSFRFPLTWTVLLLVPVVALNWAYSQFLVLPVRFSVWLPWYVWVFWGVKGMAIGVFEEVIFRGYAFRRMPEAHPRLVVATTAICFALAHFPGILERPLTDVLSQMRFAVVVGFALSLIRMISGSLAWCMVLHGAINSAAQLKLPGLSEWTVNVLILVAVASLITFWRHSAFKHRLPVHHLAPEKHHAFS